MVRIAFSSISRCSASIGRSTAITRWASVGVALGERVDRIGDLLLGKAAHLGDHAGELLQVDVEGLDGVFGHRHCLSSLPTRPVPAQPKRPVM